MNRLRQVSRAAMWRAPHVAWLAALWVLLWEDASVGVWIAGALVGLVVLAVRPSMGHRTHTVRLVAGLRLLGRVVVDIVRANVVITLETLTPTDHTQEGIIDVELPTDDQAAVTTTAQAINLSPGTVVVGQPAADTLSVHVLHLSDPDRTREEIRHVAALAAATFVPHRIS